MHWLCLVIILILFLILILISEPCLTGKYPTPAGVVPLTCRFSNLSGNENENENEERNRMGFVLSSFSFCFTFSFWIPSQGGRIIRAAIFVIPEGLYFIELLLCEGFGHGLQDLGSGGI
jgi:hypothetical protein